MRLASLLWCFCAAMCVGLLSSHQCLGQPLLPPGWGSQSPRPWPVLHESRFTFYLPAPILEQEIDRYAAILVLSEAQRHYLNTLYISYINRIVEVERRRGPELLHAAEPINIRAAENDFRMTPQSVEEYGQVHAAEQRMIADLEREDDALLAQLSTILAEPQRELMDRVQLHRQRSRCITSNFLLWTSRIDLSHMASEWENAADILPDLEDFLWEYEQRVTPALMRASAAHRKSRTEDPLLTVSIAFDDRGHPLDRNTPEAAERFRLFRSRMEQNWRANTEAERRVIQINEETLPRLLERLEPGRAKEFHAAYLRLSYSRVYPDPSSPEALFSQLAASDGISPQVIEDVIALWADHLKRYESLNASLRKEIDRWREYRSLNWTTAGWREFEEATGRLLQARIDLNESSMNGIILLLPEQVRRQNAKQIDEWRQRLMQYRNSPASKAREFPSPD